MVGVDKLPDLILENILARLDAKPLLRCRCVSKYWNCLITDPYFMRSRARRSIILNTSSKLLDLVDDNKVSSPYEPWRSKKFWGLRVLGTINGIVLFQHIPSKVAGDLMLYNPLTHKYMLLPPASDGVLCCERSRFKTYAYGFGYGSAAPDELKVVRFREYNKDCPTNICGGGYSEIFSLKEFTWSETREMNIKHIEFETTVGTFLKGFLYWIPEELDKLIVLDVAKIVLSEIHLPFKRSYNLVGWPSFSHLGTINGCLCLLIRSHNLINFNLWVMNDQADKNSWSIRYSFKIPKDDVVTFYHHVICISDNGRILLRAEKQLQIYDPSDESLTLTDVFISSDYEIQGIEFEETLVSLSDVCSA